METKKERALRKEAKKLIGTKLPVSKYGTVLRDAEFLCVGDRVEVLRGTFKIKETFIDSVNQESNEYSVISLEGHGGAWVKRRDIRLISAGEMEAYELIKQASDISEGGNEFDDDEQ